MHHDGIILAVAAAVGGGGAAAASAAAPPAAAAAAAAAVAAGHRLTAPGATIGDGEVAADSFSPPQDEPLLDGAQPQGAPPLPGEVSPHGSTAAQVAQRSDACRPLPPE